MSDQTLELILDDGTKIVVPANLTTISTYVLLEKERWFEKEIDFVASWLKPGMVAIDVGANYGVFSLLMARLVGLAGHVTAYEPTSSTRALLEASRAANGFAQLDIRPFALSDGTRSGFLTFGTSGELNALGDGGSGETVEIRSLDGERSSPGWLVPDFIKIDAEGEEERILAGARNLLADHSPLVMFELKAGAAVNIGLIEAFQAMGYMPFRQLGGLPMLVPYSASQPPDAFELNLFAAKPDRAASMVAEGMLLLGAPAWAEEPGAVAAACDAWSRLDFAGGFPNAAATPLQADYGRALAAYHTFRTAKDPAQRVAGLWFALQVLAELCRRHPTAARMLTLARVAADYGSRASAVNVLNNLLQRMGQQRLDLSEPFWPPLARYETLPVGADAHLWLRAAIIESLEVQHAHSSAFAPPLAELDWLCQQPFAAAEMVRRTLLRAARKGQNPHIPARLAVAAGDHRNSALWASGKVPGTRPAQR